MQTHLFSLSTLLAISTLTVACGSSLTSPSATLTGSWTLTSIQPSGQAPQNRPADATYMISFSDGRLSTRADCNQCTGSYSISGSTLTAGPNLACTRAACPTMAFENAYVQILSGESQIALSGSALTLTSSRGLLSFTRMN